MPTSSLHEFIKSPLWLVVLGSLIATANALFPSERFGSATYLQFVLAQGPLFTLSFSFLSVIWSDLDKNEGLVSADPARYVSACLVVVGGVFHALGHAWKSRRYKTNEECTQETKTDFAGPRSPIFSVIWAFALMFSTLVLILVRILEQFIGLAILGLLLCISLLWLFLIAPPLYFVTLVSGAPARISLRNFRGRALLVREFGRWVTKTESSDEDDVEMRGSPEDPHNTAEQIQDLERRLAELEAKHREKGLPITKIREVEDELKKMKNHLRRTTIDITLSERPVSLTYVISSILMALANPIMSKLVA